jgi:hypothetical protein
MADIAKGLAIGYGIGERAYNAYQQADEQRRIKAIQDAQTEQSYSPDDLARLQGLYNQQQQVVQEYTAAPGMGAERGGAVYDEAGAQAEMARRGLIVNPNVSPAGQVQGFNYGLSQRGMGADRGAPGMDQTIQAQQGVAPRAAFLGQQYDPSALTPEKMNSLRYGAMADVIGGRDPAGALRMRSEIRQNELRDEEAGRQRQLFPGQLEEQTLGIAGKKLANRNAENEASLFPDRQKMSTLTVEGAERKAKLEIGNADAGKAFSEFMANAANNGKTPTTQEMYAFATQYGADPAHVSDLALKHLGYTKQAADAEIQNTIRDLSKASAGGTPTLNKFLADKFDPDASDGINPKIVGDAKTGFRVMYGNKPMPGYEGTYDSVNAIVATVQGNIKGDPMGALQTITEIRAREAQIRASNASAEYQIAHKAMLGRGFEGKSVSEKAAAMETLLNRKLTEDEKLSLGGINRKLSTDDPASKVRLEKMLVSDEWSRAKTPAEQREIQVKYGVIPSNDPGLAGYPSAAPAAASPAAPASAARPAPAPYVPPAGSPAAISLERRNAIGLERQAATTAATQDIAGKAASVLQSPSIQAAYAVQQDPNFSYLPVEQRARIQAIVMGRR